MSKEGYWVYDEDEKDYILVPYDELDPELLEKLRSVPPTGGFCYSAHDFINLPLSIAPFYISHGWLPRQGKALIYAPAKAGKSYLSLQLARAIGSGQEFLGMPTTQGRVLYLQFEMGLEILQSRMKETGQDYDNVFVDTSFSMKLDKDSEQKYLKAAMLAIRPDVLILDPLRPVISGDENEAKDMGILVDFLDEIIEEFNCSILVIHHAGKDIQRGSRGSSVFEGWVDAYIAMKKISKKGEPLRCEIEPVSLRHAAPAEPMQVELGKDFEFHLYEPAQKETAIDKVITWAEQEGTFTSGEIHNAGLGSRNPVQDALNELIAKGCIEKTKRGVYNFVKQHHKEKEDVTETSI
jgi:hypothetical protein